MGYEDPPWIFKGKALYQLQLVKSSEARHYVPDRFKLVELFGYTLGGFYLAKYTDSPVGPFNELVVLGGLVWNAPSSCAWAARVYVDNKQARDHGLHHVGLPSRLATFHDLAGGGPEPPGASLRGGGQAGASWWRADPSGAGGPSTVTVVNKERRRWRGPSRGLSVPVCEVALPGRGRAWSPRIRLQLPSFSGGTPQHPGLLHYVCHLATNIRFVGPARLRFPGLDAQHRLTAACPSAAGAGRVGVLGSPGRLESQSAKGQAIAVGGELVASLMRGKPVLSMCFDEM